MTRTLDPCTLMFEFDGHGAPRSAGESACLDAKRTIPTPYTPLIHTFNVSHLHATTSTISHVVIVARRPQLRDVKWSCRSISLRVPPSALSSRCDARARTTARRPLCCRARCGAACGAHGECYVCKLKGTWHAAAPRAMMPSMASTGRAYCAWDACGALRGSVDAQPLCRRLESGEERQVIGS